jgi:DNA-binding NarL/FixJ family response regulator
MRVVLAEDHIIVRQGLASLLRGCGQEIVGEAGEMRELFDLLDTTQCDVVVLDIAMPPHHHDEGLQAARQIRRSRPEIALLILSMHPESAYAREVFSLDDHALGYYTKQRATAGELCDAVRRVARGELVLSSDVVQLLMQHQPRATRLATLSPREKQVLSLLAEGRTNHAIAEALKIGKKQVEDHVSTIFDKLRLPTNPDSNRRVLATLEYLRQTAQRNTPGMDAAGRSPDSFRNTPGRAPPGNDAMSGVEPVRGTGARFAANLGHRHGEGGPSSAGR